PPAPRPTLFPYTTLFRSDEIGARDREERHIRLAGDSAGEQGLAGAWRPHQQHALWDLSTESLKLLGVLQVFDDFLEFLLGFVDADRKSTRLNSSHVAISY